MRRLAYVCLRNLFIFWYVLRVTRISLTTYSNASVHVASSRTITVPYHLLLELASCNGFWGSLVRDADNPSNWITSKWTIQPESVGSYMRGQEMSRCHSAGLPIIRIPQSNRKR